METLATSDVQTGVPVPASAHLHVIDARTVRETIFSDIEGCFEVVASAYLAYSEGEGLNPPSVLMRFPGHAANRIIALPAHLEAPWNVSGIKWIASYPDNICNGLARASAVVILNETQHGYPFACLEGSIISAARTAASAVLAARHLCAKPRRVRSFGVVGAGLIARNVYQFMIATGWVMRKLVLFDSNPAAAAAFAEQTGAQARHESVRIADTPESLLRCCDLVLFATTAPAPFVSDVAAVAHNPVILHVSLRDLAPELILRSWNVTDAVEHVLSANTSLHLAEQAIGSRHFVTTDISSVLTGRWRPDHSRPIVFSPFGLGVLDIAVAKWVYDRAVARGRVQVIENFRSE